VSIPLQKLNTPDFISRRWMSRAVTSLKSHTRRCTRGLLRREVLSRFLENHGKFKLVIEFFRQMLRINNRCVRSDDGIHVLKKHNPWKYGMRKSCLLGILVVLAEISAVWKNFLER